MLRTRLLPLAAVALVAPMAACSAQSSAGTTVAPADPQSTSSRPSTTPSSGSPASDAAAAPATTPASTFRLTTNVADGATKVPVSTLLTVTPSQGTVDTVTVASSATGKNAVPKITGTTNAKGVWVANTRLDPGARYTVTATGTGTDGTTRTSNTSFRTQELDRSREVFPTLSPVINGPYGVAQPVVVQFDVPVKNKAEFERNMHVTSIPAQEGSWGWFDDRTVRWRPRTYWKPGTKVKLDANLNGVDAGGGNYGQLNRTLELTIGRKQLGKVDIARHTISWQVGDAKPVTYDMTAGKPGFTTRSGTKVVMEKAENIKMASETTGIARDSAEGYNVDVAYALRVTSSGEFIHSAPWNAGNFGVRNASHGCVGMSTDSMYRLYTTAQIGDPVVFTGSKRTLEDGNGWTDWNLSWEQWRKKSALR
ncbi:L,D-transpeptidase [Luteococcus peritonei]|uniref:Ig-like domain-containing protein n=1 Tax=Luteococcus peritonei TaxID=88874 RepID=A0ABW4RWB5_9ACTN